MLWNRQLTAHVFSKTSASLRRRLIAIILILVGPLAVFQGLELAQVKWTRTRLTQEQAYDLAKAGAARYQDIIDDARSVLELLSKVSEVTGENIDACAGFLHDVVRTHPWARTLFVVNAAGRVTCTTNPAARNFDLSSREWFQSARVSGVFSVSDFLISQVSLQPSAFATFFFHNERTGEQQVIASNLDLSWIDRLSATISERKDALIMLVDGAGVIISRFPASPIPGFARIPQHLRQHAAEPSKELFAGIDPDGKQRLFGSFPLSGAKGRVIVGFDRSAALGLIDLYIWIAAAVFLGVMLLGSLAVWFIGDRIFIRPIEQLNRLLKTTLDTMDQGLIAIDPGGRAAVINSRAMTLLDLPQELAASQPHQDEILKHQFDRGEFPGPAQFATITKDIAERRRGIYERERPDGTVLEIRTVPTDDGGLVRTYSDITRRRAVETELVREKERALAAAHAASEFLTNMSHELRTPLTAIIGVSEMLLSGNASPDQQRRFMTMQRNAGQALLGVINDVLDFSKIEAQQLHLEDERFSLRDAVAYCESIVGELAGRKGLTLSVSIVSGAPVWVRGDVSRVQQILLNLLSNAVKFTEFGSVRLRVESCDDADSMIRFVVADTGVGIAADYLPDLFQRFSQADSSTTRRFGGTGLGLAISRKLAFLMQGDICVASEPLKGSVFTFTARLPVSDGPVELLELPRPRRAGYRLLLAEDNELNRQIITAMLEQAGHRVEAVNDGAAAVRAALDGDFDAILMDVQMPELDGYAAATMIRKVVPDAADLPIIALTANALSDEAERCLNAGMSAYLSKPVDWNRLLSMIEQLAGKYRTAEAGTAEASSAAPQAPLAVLNPETLDRIRTSIGEVAMTNLLTLFVIEAGRRFKPSEPDDDGARRADAHSFGGSAGMLGFDRVSRACAALQSSDLSAAEFEWQFVQCCIERDHAVAEAQRILANARATSQAG